VSLIRGNADYGFSARLKPFGWIPAPRHPPGDAHGVAPQRSGTRPGTSMHGAR
jgi:hypothetical protein